MFDTYIFAFVLNTVFLLCRDHIEYEEVNLDKLSSWIAQGRVDVSKPITMKTMLDSGLCTRIKHGVKILGGVCVRICGTNQAIKLISSLFLDHKNSIYSRISI